jgi:sterol-4alpha-carboxylate 3-dehydrogenase (decarboxylating)
MLRIFQDVRPDVFIHTASHKFDATNQIIYKVIVDGNKTLTKIAEETGTRSFNYSSFASVTSDSKTDLKNADETLPVNLDGQQPEFNVYAKVLAETHVLSRNHRTQDSSPNFHTCATRPPGIFGVGDLVILSGILDAYFCGQTKVQIGNNQNLFDFTENKNVAQAHYLAAVTLTRSQKVPPEDDVKVDGEAFFISNNEPRCFWNFMRLAWIYAGDATLPDQVCKNPSSKFATRLTAIDRSASE